MANLTKRELTIRISNKTGIPQIAVKEVIQKTLDYIVESLQKGQNIELRNFGVFTVKNRKARTGRNPNKPQEVVTIPAKKVAYFKPGRVMKKLVEKTL